MMKDSQLIEELYTDNVFAHNTSSNDRNAHDLSVLHAA